MALLVAPQDPTAQGSLWSMLVALDRLRKSVSCDCSRNLGMEPRKECVSWLPENRGPPCPGPGVRSGREGRRTLALDGDGGVGPYLNEAPAHGGISLSSGKCDPVSAVAPGVGTGLRAPHAPSTPPLWSLGDSRRREF